MAGRFFRWLGRLGLAVTLASSFFGMGSVPRLEAARNADCVLSAEQFAAPPVGSEPYYAQDMLVFGADDVWVATRVGADYVLAEDSLVHWDGTRWNQITPPMLNESTARMREEDANRRSAKDQEFYGTGRALLGGTSSNDLYWYSPRRQKLMHWNGVSWSIVRHMSSGWISSLDVRTASDIWFGDFDVIDPPSALFTHWDGTTWKEVKGPRLGTGTRIAEVRSLSRKNAWAVGTFTNAGQEQAMILHWNGKRWIHVPVATQSGSRLVALTVINKKDIWAVGSRMVNGTWRPLALHWNGKTWRKVAVPVTVPSTENLDLTSVTSFGKNEAWAAGVAENRSFLFFWNGVNWREQAVPSQFYRLEKVVATGPAQLWAIDAREPMYRDGAVWQPRDLPWFGTYTDGLKRVYGLATDDVWAIGQELEHWDGAAWKVIKVPNVPRSFHAIAGRVPDELVVLASSFANRELRYVVLYWDGTTWNTLPDIYRGPDGLLLRDIAMLAPDDIWIGGSLQLGPGQVRVTRHWDGTAWSDVPVPEMPGQTVATINRLYARAPNDIWAIGTGILHWDGTAWRESSSQSADAMTFVAADDIWAAAQDTFLHYDGQDWTAFPSVHPFQKGTYWGLVGFAADDVYAFGRWDDYFSNYEIRIEHWDGTTWNVVEDIENANLTDDLSRVSDNEFWTVATGHAYRGSSFALIVRYQRMCE